MRPPRFERPAWRPREDGHDVAFIGRGWLRRGEPVRAYAGFDKDAFMETRRESPPRSIDGSLAWIFEAANALSAPRDRPVAGANRRDAIQEATDRRRILELAAGPMSSYSHVEIGRALAADAPRDLSAKRFTPSYVKKLISRGPELPEREIDRFGDEPHFLFAAHLAFYMLGVPDGTTEADALDSFVRDPRLGALYLWPDFDTEDLDRLRSIYPFIPHWPTGHKTKDCLSLGTEFPETIRGRLYGDLIREIRELAQIPMADPTLEDIAAIRDERDKMKGAQLVECTGVFADLVPRMELMLAADGLRGKDVHIVSKHYSTDPLVARTVSRVFGTKIEIVEGDAEILERTKAAIIGATDRVKNDAPLIAHIEGIKSFWSWYADHQRAHPDVRMAGVSHTSSDGRDLLESIGDGDAPLPLELMCFSDPKVKDERDRFKRTFGRLLYDVGDSLNQAIFNRHYLVLGYGRIVGPAMADALKAAEVEDLVIYDPDPERRQAAVDAGFKVIESLDGEYERSPFIISCAGACTLDATHLARFKGSPTLLSLGSGRGEFDMPYLEREAANGEGVTKREIGRLGHQPIIEYSLPNGTRYTALADGYVANLAYPRPTIPAYSVTTPLLVWESIRQCLDHLDARRNGTHLFRAVDIDLSKRGTRWITLFPREVETMTPEQARVRYTNVGVMGDGATTPYAIREAKPRT